MSQTESKRGQSQNHSRKNSNLIQFKGKKEKLAYSKRVQTPTIDKDDPNKASKSDNLSRILKLTGNVGRIRFPKRQRFNEDAH